MKKPILKDPEKQQEYESRGYTVIPFLGEQEIARLTDFYASLEFTGTARALCSVLDERPLLFHPMREEFGRVAAQAIEQHFQQCDMVFGNFLVKRPYAGGVLPPHQDWTVVDETQESTGTVWVPLLDVDFENGAMGVLPGSRRFFPGVRCAPSRYGYRMLPYAGYAMDLLPYLDFRPLKAGEALVFDPGSVHGSLPNKGLDSRIVAVFGVAPRETRFSISYFLPHTELSKFEMFEYPLEAFVEYPNARLMALYEQGEKPTDLASLGVYDFRPTRISAQEAIAMIEQAGCRRWFDGR